MLGKSYMYVFLKVCWVRICKSRCRDIFSSAVVDANKSSISSCRWFWPGGRVEIYCVQLSEGPFISDHNRRVWVNYLTRLRVSGWCIIINLFILRKKKTSKAQRFRRANSFDVLCVLFSRSRRSWHRNKHIRRVYPRPWMFAAVWAVDLGELSSAISSLYQVEMQRDLHIRTKQTCRNTYI